MVDPALGMVDPALGGMAVGMIVGIEPGSPDMPGARSDVGLDG